VVARTDVKTFWEKYLPPLWPPIWPPLWPPVWRPLPVSEHSAVQLHTQRERGFREEQKIYARADADVVELSGNAEPRDAQTVTHYGELGQSVAPLARQQVETELVRYSSAIWWEQYRTAAGEGE
jgi:hypothetical protein